MMSKERIIQARETYSSQHKVLTKDDLLTQILIRLPILYIHLFAIMSKQWLRITTSLIFIKNRSQITKVDPPVGLFVNHIRSLFESDFVSLDPRLQSKKSAIDRSFTLGITEEADNINILQSCNGLLLCGGSGMPVFDYVYNSSTNQYKKLPYPDCSLDNSPYYSSAGLRIAFDPTKSPHYKLVDVGRTFCDIDIQIYSSETGKWSLCRDYDFGSSEFTIYEMMIREQDSFLVIKLFGKVVQYNLISKIYDCGSNKLDDNHDDDDDDDDDDDELL
ncbi:hypothetical protein Tco_0660678 [Tanacetum coccineum]